MNYQCKICGDVRNSAKATIMHIRRTHKEVDKPVIDEHYFQTSGKKEPAKTKYAWQKWQKHPDGSRKFKLVNSQWVKQKPGIYFLNSNRKARLKDDDLPKIIGIKDEPKIHSDGIIINVLVKIPLSVGLPVIIPHEDPQ